MERTQEQARSGAPMTADQVEGVISELEANCKSRSARHKMALAAVRRGVVTDAGRKVWSDYLASF